MAVNTPSPTATAQERSEANKRIHTDGDAVETRKTSGANATQDAEAAPRPAKAGMLPQEIGMLNARVPRQARCESQAHVLAATLAPGAGL
jgi:hypothetical protein